MIVLYYYIYFKRKSSVVENKLNIEITRILNLIIDHIGPFLTVLCLIGTLIWHLITQYFDYKNHKLDVKERLADQDNRINKNTDTLGNLKTLITEFVAAADSKEARLKAEILAATAEQDKQILFKVLDQETRNSSEYRAMSKVFGDIEKQLSLMNINMQNQGKSIDSMSMKIDGIEKEKLEDLKEKLATYRHNHPPQ